MVEKSGSEGILLRRALSCADARHVLDALLEAAACDGLPPVAIAITDEHGDLLAFARAEGTPLRSIAIAINKAYTAVRIGIPTQAFAQRLADAHYTLQDYCDPRFTALPGGIPIALSDGTIIGGVGVSGRAPAEDHALASQWYDHLVSTLAPDAPSASGA